MFLPKTCHRQPRCVEILVTEKTMRYVNKNLDLDQLCTKIVDYMNGEGYGTQKSKASLGIIIEARKENLPRDLITADRCFTILLQGQPDNFTITVGIGRWVQNLTVAAVEAILTAGAFLIVDIPEMVWNEHIEDKIVKGIANIVEGKQLAHVVS